MNENNLIFIRFREGTIAYTEDFQVKVDGKFWAREMDSALRMTQIYKEQHKLSNGK